MHQALDTVLIYLRTNILSNLRSAREVSNIELLRIELRSQWRSNTPDAGIVNAQELVRGSSSANVRTTFLVTNDVFFRRKGLLSQIFV